MKLNIFILSDTIAFTYQYLSKILIEIIKNVFCYKI